MVLIRYATYFNPAGLGYLSFTIVFFVSLFPSGILGPEPAAITLHWSDLEHIATATCLGGLM